MSQIDSTDASTQSQAAPSESKLQQVPAAAPESSGDVPVSEPTPARHPALVQTPSKTPGSVRAAATPARRSREAERTELADLNKRLEFYILHQREKEASQSGIQRELDALRERYDGETRDMKALYENQFEMIRKTRDELSKQVLALQEDKSQRDTQLNNQSQELASLNKFKSQLEDKYKACADELQNTRASSFAADEENKKLRHQLQIETARTEDLRRDNDKLRDRADKAGDSLRALESQCSSLQESITITEKRYTEDKTLLEGQVGSLSQQAARSEDEIRKEFHKQMAQALTERQLAFEQEKNDGFAQLKALYDDKMSGFRTELEIVGHEIEMERSNTKKAQAELNKFRTHNQELLALRDSLATRIAELEEMLRQERSKPNARITEKNEIIRKLKDAFKRKDTEFEELMDVKIALAMELRAYRQMLEHEEDRLGYKSPLKKRKTMHRPTPSSMGETKDSSTSDSDKSAGLLISGSDIEGKFIQIRNGSTETVSLAGWKLRSRQKQREYVFPTSAKLRPGAAYCVKTPDQSASVARKKGSGGFSTANNTMEDVWTTSDVWDASGDEALLIHPDGETMATVDVIVTTSQTPVHPSSSSSSASSSLSDVPSSSSSSSSAPSVAAPTALSFSSSESQDALPNQVPLSVTTTHITTTTTHTSETTSLLAAASAASSTGVNSSNFAVDPSQQNKNCIVM